MRAELAGPSATLLESMAVDRVVACWLQLQHADSIAARPDGGALPALHYRLKWQEKANKRYLDAVRSLMDLRRLLPHGDALSRAGAGVRVFNAGSEDGLAPASQSMG